MHRDDPHGSRGTTEHHALDYKKEVQAFSTADILAAAQQGGAVARRPARALGGGGGGPPGATAAAAPPANTPGNHHALDYKSEVRAFSSADILKAFSNSQSGKPDEGIASAPAAARGHVGGSLDSAAAESGAATSSIAADARAAEPNSPSSPDVRVRSWQDEGEAPTREGGGWNVDRLKDALATTDADLAPTHKPAAAPATSAPAASASERAVPSPLDPPRSLLGPF